MIANFIKVPADIVEQGQEREDMRLPLVDVKEYRKWKTEDGQEKTVFFFKKFTGRSKLIVPLSVDEVDERLGVVNLL